MDLQTHAEVICEHCRCEFEFGDKGVLVAQVNRTFKGPLTITRFEVYHRRCWSMLGSPPVPGA